MGPSLDKYFAPILPGISFDFLLPRPKKNNSFPFNSPETHYFYNARSAIYTLAKALNLEDQEVLFPAYCCGTELEALLAADVKIIPYPVHAGMKVSFDEIKGMVTDKIRAIYLTHFLGFPGPVEELLALCKERNIYLIEDCALSLFSCINDRPLGSFGHGAVFSIYKTLPVPSGGVLVFNNGISPQLPQRISPPTISTLKHLIVSIQRQLSLSDMKILNKSLNLLKPVWRAVKKRTKSEPVIEIMSEKFDASVSKLTMSKVSHWIVNSIDPKLVVEKHRYNHDFLRNRLKNHVEPVFDSVPDGVCPLVFAFMVSDSEIVAKALHKGGIEAWAFWNWTPPLLEDKTPPELLEMRKRIVVVPCHEGLSEDKLDRIADEVIAVVS